MEKNIVVKNTPINTKKASFFKSLIAFYDAYDGELSDKAKAIKDNLEDYAVNDTHIHYYSIKDVTILNAELLGKMTPCHKRKRAMYRALVAYMDEILGTKVADTSYEDDADSNSTTDDDSNTTKFIGMVVGYFPSIGSSIFKSVVKDNYDKKVTQKPTPTKKTYKVAVTFESTVYVEVEAENESKAREIAEEEANYYDAEDYQVLDSEVYDY